MTETKIAPEYQAVLDGAARLAWARGEGVITPTHLLLATMADSESDWPLLIVERGGLNFRHAAQRLGWQGIDRLEEAARAEPPPYRSPMRIMAMVLLGLLIALLLNWRRSPAAPPALSWSTSAAEVLAIAQRVAGRAGRPEADPAVGVGQLLLALASTPGRHLRLIDGGTVVACAVRRELGLDARQHRLVLACDRGKLACRRWGMKLDRRVATHGRWSRWGVLWAANSLLGLMVAAVVLPITLFANVILYIFLWPAALLMGGLRAIVGLALGCRITNHRWHEIPGGELGLGGVERRISERRLAALVMVPRLLGFALAVAALAVIIWRGARLGVFAFPTLFARPDIVSGAAPDSFWLTPVVIFVDMLEQNGVAGGIGLLAGAGLGFMSMPTYRELNLVRLYAGHDLGLGSRLARLLTLPATVFTGAIACIEAILPFRNGPIYLTVYLLPMVFTLLVAILVVDLLPY